MKRVLPSLGRVAITGLFLVLAIPVGRHFWSYYMLAPWTRDGRVRADVVQVAADVSGLVSEVLVHDNQLVSKGDALFQIDRERFRFALAQAQAAVGSRRATLEQARRDLIRNENLTETAISKQAVERSEEAVEVAQSDLYQAMAGLDVAKLNLRRATVIAQVNGVVTNFSLRPGQYVNAGGSVFALIDRDTLRIEAYIEETKLRRIHVGDSAKVLLMGDDQELPGHVESIAFGIEDQSRGPSGDLLANVNPTFNWVRLAQRVPVRVKLDRVPDDVHLVSGRTATVSIGDSLEFVK
jgi:multidrug resistance efflux pump